MKTDRLDRYPAALGWYSTLSTSIEAVQDDDDDDVDNGVDDNVADDHVFKRWCEYQAADLWSATAS